MIEVSYHQVAEARVSALVAFASHGDPVSGIGRVQNNGREIVLDARRQIMGLSSRKLSMHPWAVERRLRRLKAKS